MAVNDKLCFDVLFRNVILLPRYYSLEKRECMTPYGNGIAEGVLFSHSCFQGRSVYIHKYMGGDHQHALCSLAVLLLIAV